MGLDVAVGLLVDDAGNDVYRAVAVAQGAATANGFGLLADRGGADRFEIGPSLHAWGHAEWMRGLPSVGVLLNGGRRAIPRATARRRVQASCRSRCMAPTPLACPAEDPGDALLCRLDQAADPEAVWRELSDLLARDPATPLAGSIAIGLARRPPPRAIGDEIAARLAQRRKLQRARARAARMAYAAGGAGRRALDPAIACSRPRAPRSRAWARRCRRMPRCRRSCARSPPQDDTF